MGNLESDWGFLPATLALALTPGYFVLRICAVDLKNVPETAEIDQIQYTRFQMTSSEVVHGGLGSKICHRRRGWVPRTQARADGCGRHLDRGERLNAALTMN